MKAISPCLLDSSFSKDSFHLMHSSRVGLVLPILQLDRLQFDFCRKLTILDFSSLALSRQVEDRASPLHIVDVDAESGT